MMEDPKKEPAKQEAKAKEAPGPKKPSKIFTDYYGSLLLLLLAAYVAAGFLVLKPKIDAYKDTQSRIQGLQQEVQNDQTYFDGLSRSVSAAQGIDPQVLKKVDLALPRASDIPDLLTQLNAAAAQSGVGLSGVVFEAKGNVPATNGLQALNITLSLTAKNYAQVKDFLTVLETSLRIFDVQTITVGGFDAERVSFNLQMRTYYYPVTEGAQPGATSTSTPAT